MKYLLLAFMAIAFWSCTDFSKNQYITSYEDFVKEASTNYINYDDQKRKESDEKFQQFSEVDYKKYEGNFTPEEKAKVNQLAGKYYAIVAKQKATSVTKELENLLDKTKGVLDELKN
jgi:hypothetical protein